MVAIVLTVAALSTLSFRDMKAQLYLDSEQLVAGLAARETAKVAEWLRIRQAMLTAAGQQLEGNPGRRCNSWSRRAIFSWPIWAPRKA
ncbi:hypothetical protein MBH78_02130 [Oceanimonas sp. NS1]|nr:hypothetical protein [Oceanimonas sp. NS1]